MPEAALREDQASSLRRILRPAAPRLLCLAAADPRRAAPYACRLAAALEAVGEGTLLVDLTRGELARAAGIAGRYELMHVLDRAKRMDEVVFFAGDVPVLPAARGVRALATAWRGRERLARALEQAGGQPRLALALGEARALGALAAAAGPFPLLLLLTAASAAEVTGAYAILKRTHALGLEATLACDPGLAAAEAQTAARALARAASDYLGRSPRPLGRLDPAELAGRMRDMHVHR